MKNPLIATLVAFTAACPLQAAIILVDFGPSSGNTTGTPDTWNNFNDAGAGANQALRTSTNAVSNYTLTFNGAVNHLNDDPAPAAPTSPPAPFTPFSVTRDGIFTTATTTITLSGLEAGLTYSISLYSYVNRDSTRLTRFAIDGTNIDVEPARLAGATSGAVATFSNITPTAGSITITASSQASTNWILNAMSISYVPEPSSAILALSGAGLFCIRRRRA